MKKIKQGGMLGHKLRQARKINIMKCILGAIILLFAVGASTESASAGLTTAALFGVVGIHRDPGTDPAGGGTPEEKELLKKVQEKIKSALDGESELTKKELKKLLDKYDELNKTITESKLEETKAEVIRLAAELKALKETGTKEEKQTLAAELKAKFTELKDVAKRLSAKEIVVKALTARASITNNQQAMDLPEIGQMATRKLTLYDLFPKVQVGENNNGTVRYYDWDEATTVRAAAAVAEGVAFDESTAKFKKGSVVIQKIGDTLPVTDEFFEDEAMFASELELFLQTNVAMEIDRQLADGDGTSNTIVGLKASVDAYTLPSSGSIVAPNIYDLIVKVSEAITTTGGSKYMPDFAVMHISDINKMKLSKDANNNYILPPFVSRDGQQVSTITVIESNIITANTMVVGDKRFGRIYEKTGIELSRGMVNTQFTEDEMTLKARKRLAFLIRGADKGGFLKVTDIDAALVALTII